MASRGWLRAAHTSEPYLRLFIIGQRQADYRPAPKPHPGAAQQAEKSNNRTSGRPAPTTATVVYKPLLTITLRLLQAQRRANSRCDFLCTPTRLARASGAGGVILTAGLHIVTSCLDGLSRARLVPAYVSIPSFRPSNPLFGPWPPCRSRLPAAGSQRSVPFPTPPPKKRGLGPFVRRRTTPSSNPGKGHLRVVGVGGSGGTPTSSPGPRLSASPHSTPSRATSSRPEPGTSQGGSRRTGCHTTGASPTSVTTRRPGPGSGWQRSHAHASAGRCPD